jgi:diacylglycerol kinase family enzyme
MPRAVVIYNPIAGGSLGAAVSGRVQARLEAAGFEVDRHATMDRRGAGPIARDAAGRADRIVAVGGDGTLREVVAGLREAADRTAVGVVPMGNANIVAHELGIPTDVDGAIEVLVEGEAVDMDLGRFRTDEHEGLFLGVVGVGWDADAVGMVDRFRHTQVGRRSYRTWADGLYGAAGLAAALRPGQARFTLSADGAPASGREYRAAFLCNLRTYGKAMTVTPDAHRASGLIHVQGRHSAFPPFLAWQIGAALLGRKAPSFVSDYLEGRTFELRADVPFQVQVDGDARGSTRRLDVEVLPRAVRILAPRGSSGAA